jgi:hypothetical protein
MLNFGGSVDATSATSPASAAHRIPAIHATLRDHQVKKDRPFFTRTKLYYYQPNGPFLMTVFDLIQDWVLRKKHELDSLRLAGDVTGLQKQLDENETFR